MIAAFLFFETDGDEFRTWQLMVALMLTDCAESTAWRFALQPCAFACCIAHAGALAEASALRFGARVPGRLARAVAGRVPGHRSRVLGERGSGSPAPDAYAGEAVW